MLFYQHKSLCTGYLLYAYGTTNTTTDIFLEGSGSYSGSVQTKPRGAPS